jgi:hypothetical protein
MWNNAFRIAYLKSLIKEAGVLPLSKEKELLETLKKMRQALGHATFEQVLPSTIGKEVEYFTRSGALRTMPWHKFTEELYRELPQVRYLYR